MLAFFPECNNDELLYSVLARYHLISGNVSPKGTLLELFGTDTICSVTDMPSHLAALCKRLPANISPDFILQKHTLFPFYAPFLPPEKARLIRQSMLGDGGSAIHMQSGIMASSIPVPSYLRYCTNCFMEDDHKLGQPYWHRLHQIPGVLICPVHHVLLQHSTVPYTLKHNRQTFEVLSRDVLQEQKSGPSELDKQNFMLLIAQQVQWALTHTIEPKTNEQVREFYVSRLEKLGYVTVGGSVRFRELLPDFVSFYGYPLLKKLSSFVDDNDHDTWFHKLLRKPRISCHPLRHILLLNFLHETISSLFDQSIQLDELTPFGEAPWPCLNKAAIHYKENVVTECLIKLDQNTKRPLGTFKCNCGFTYTRKGHQEVNDRYSGCTKVYGEVWLAGLNVLSQLGLSLRELGRRLDVDTNTVKKYLRILKEGVPETIKVNDRKNQCYSYRCRWMEHLTQHPYNSRTELRRSLSAVYIWLYRHDRQWLINSLPPRRGTESKYKRVDWEERDVQLSGLVQLATEELLSCSEQPIRITVSRIGLHINQLSLLEKHLNRLPKTKGILDQVTETVEQFQVRRVQIVSKALCEAGVELKHWRIVREAGLRPNHHPIVETYILQELGLNYDEVF